MVNIIVAFPKIEDARIIKSVLVRSGFFVTAVCTTGAQVINYAESLNGGIVICGYRFLDMMYEELYSYLPRQFEMLLIASRKYWSECADNDMVCLEFPIKTNDLINTIDMIAQALVAKKKKQRQIRKGRSEKESAAIEEAKKILMERNNMTEAQAHRYIQKCSMDSGTNMAETAEMILKLMIE